MNARTSRSIFTLSSLRLLLTYRYGMLILLLGLLACNILLCLSALHRGNRNPYGGLIVNLILLFNHLSFVYKGRHRWVRVAFEVLSLVWLVFGFLYFFYWSDVLYPQGVDFRTF